MSDTADFFANKKKKKKTFKFNANKIDAAAITSSVTHVDAPAVSTEHDATAAVSSNVTDLNLNDAGTSNTTAAGKVTEQWDDKALAASLYARKPTVASTPAAGAALLDIKALAPKRGEQDDIAEKLRVEETKARLAAAREGMEREAQRMKEERERKEQEKREKEAASTASSSGKWVPSHLRNAAAASTSGGLMGRSGFGSSFLKQELDVQDENLFPDLAAADAILEQQHRQQQEQLAQKIPKKTPVGAGAAWASRRKSAAESKQEAEAKTAEPVSNPATTVADSPPFNAEPQTLKTEEPNQDENVDVANDAGVEPAIGTEVEAGSVSVESEKVAEVAKTEEESGANDESESAEVKVVKKKKKKKDLSTFTPS